MIIPFLYYTLWYFLEGVLLLLVYQIVVKNYCDTMSAFGWIFWPDIDVKFIGGKEFIEKYTSKKFILYIIFLWWVRVTHITLIFAWFTFLWIAMGVTLLIMLGYDFGTEIINKLKFFTGSGAIKKTN